MNQTDTAMRKGIERYMLALVDAIGKSAIRDFLDFYWLEFWHFRHSKNIDFSKIQHG